MHFSKNQVQRLREIGCSFNAEYSFASAEARELAFKEVEQRGVENNRSALHELKKVNNAPFVDVLAESISLFLRGQGFLEVSTPIIISKRFLGRMTIDDCHALYQQVFWLDDKTCLRPMLAPNLYDLSQRLLNIYGQPLGVFEIGPCFRRESQGNKHLESFTMVSFVEWGTEEAKKVERLKEIISLFMKHIHLEEYSLEEEVSVVYGDTVDVVVKGVEIASGAFGPHPLDSNWDYDGTWIGLGAGLERIVMMQEGFDSIQKAGRSLAYLGGISLKLK